MGTPIDSEKNAPAGDGPNLPAIPTINESSLVSAVGKIKEIIETREGRRGSKYEQVVTWRDLWKVGLIAFDRGGNWIFNQSDGAVQGTTLINQTPGMRSTLEAEIRSSRAYKELFQRINSPESLAGFPDEVRAALSQDIADVARQYGAAIRQIDTVIQDLSRSFAMRVQEITAATDSAQAGIRSLAFASATKDKAQAGIINQVRARLDNFGGTGVTVEQKLVATVDRINGLSGTYTVKIDANGKFAGFVLAVDAPVNKPPISQFLINADQLAFFSNDGQVMPFMADASGVYLNGQLRVNTTGKTLAELATSVSTPGKRGSLNLYASGTNWSDATANAAVLSASGSDEKIIGDTVTISNGSSFSKVKYWSGFSWVDVGVVIDGNAIINGTLSGSKIYGGKIGGVEIGIGPGVAPGTNAFQVTSAGVVFVDDLYARVLHASNDSSPGNYPISGVSWKNGYEGVLGRGNASCHGVRGIHTSSAASGVVGGANGFDFYADGSGVNYGPFTGAHDALIANDSVIEVGDIVFDVRCIDRRNISNTIFEVAASNMANQKAVVGVIAKILGKLEDFQPASMIVDRSDDELTMSEAYDRVKSEFQLVAMNALGEGQINVCGLGGDIEAGDLIVASSIPGKGMRQADDVVRSYTVAKARESVQFNTVDQVKMVACIYLCG